jgi:hypothetical protein
MSKSEDPIYEYACHEGNHAMIGILAGARADEKAAEVAAKKGSKCVAAEAQLDVESIASDAALSPVAAGRWQAGADWQADVPRSVARLHRQPEWERFPADDQIAAPA